MLTVVLFGAVAALGVIVVFLAAWVCHLCEELEHAKDMVARSAELAREQNAALGGVAEKIRERLDMRV